MEEPSGCSWVWSFLADIWLHSYMAKERRQGWGSPYALRMSKWCTLFSTQRWALCIWPLSSVPVWFLGDWGMCSRHLEKIDMLAKFFISVTQASVIWEKGPRKFLGMLGSRRRQTEKAMASKPVGNIPPQDCFRSHLQVPALSICLDFPQWWHVIQSCTRK